MIIVSSFHDFYDHFFKVAEDKKVVYRRETSNSLPTEGLMPRLFRSLTLGCDHEKASKIDLLIFCGKAYAIIHSLDGQRMTTLDVAPYISQWRYVLRGDDINAMMGQDYLHINTQMKSPAVMFTHTGRTSILCEVDPMLRNIGMESCINPYEASEQIKHFFYNIMMPANHPDMISISNEDRIVSAGFDLKSSFRGSRKKSRKIK